MAMIMMVGRRSESINSAVMNGGQEINGKQVAVYPCFYVKPQKIVKRSKAILGIHSDGRIGYITDGHKVLRCGKDARHMVDWNSPVLHRITGGGGKDNG